MKRLVDILLMAGVFSVTGGLFWLLLTNYSEAAFRVPEPILSREAAAVTVAVFNAIGFALVRVNDYLAVRTPLFFGHDHRLIGDFIIIAATMLAVDYGIIVACRWLGGAEPVWLIRREGVKFLAVTWAVEMVVVGLLLAVHSTRYTLRLYEEKERMKDMADRMQFRALQSQLNPHFMFNSLNTLISEIRYDPENAVRFTQNLSDVYRYVLQQSDKQLATLGEELEFLDSYMFLHRVRLGECLFVEKDFGPELLSAKVPPLTLQLLAENVVKHNYIDEDNPMTLRLSPADGGRRLNVSNSLRPKRDVRRSGKGLANLSERYRLLCADTVEVARTEECFTVSIPLIYD